MLKNMLNNLIPALCGIFLVFPELGSALVAAETDSAMTESYDFIRLLPGGRFEAVAAADDSSQPITTTRSGTWGEITEDDAVSIKLVDELSGRDEVLKTLPNADLEPIIGRALVTDRAEQISDLGPLSFRTITLLKDGSFVATSVTDGSRIEGRYERGLKPVYDRDATTDDLQHVLMDALIFEFADQRVIMTFAVNADGSLTLEDPMAYGDYPTYRQKQN